MPFKYAWDLIKYCFAIEALVFLSFQGCAGLQDSLKNLPEYKLPITDQKLVMAHYA